jgi:hypothetical protein
MTARILAFIFALAIVSAYGQKQPSKQAEQVLQVESALAALDDPNPIARQVALESVLNSKDALVRRQAFRKAAASTDPDLKTIAFRHIFAQPNVRFDFVIAECQEREKDRNHCQQIEKETGNVWPLRFSEFQPQTMQFKPTTPYTNNSSYSEGRVSGGKARFKLFESWGMCNATLEMRPSGRVEGIAICLRVNLVGGFDAY